MFIWGCSTPLKNAQFTSLKLPPPDLLLDENQDKLTLLKHLEDLIANSKQQNEKLWAKFQFAKLKLEESPATSCPIIAELAENEVFPLKTESLLYKFKYCENRPNSLETLRTQLNIEDFPWLKEVYLDTAITLAEKQKSPQDQMELYLEKSKLPSEQKIKVEYTQKALKIAQENFPQKTEELIQRIEKLSPRYIKNPKPNQYLKIANDLRANRLFTESIVYYKKVLNKKHLSAKEKSLALKGLAKTYKVMGKKQEHIDAYENLARHTRVQYLKNPSSKSMAQQLNKNYLTLARANWTEGKVALANKTLSIAEKLLRKKYSLSEIYWIRGRMSEEKQEFEQAINWFKKSLSENPKTDIKEKVLWALAWNQQKLKLYDQAVSSFYQLVNEEKTENQNKYKYWLARTLQNIGQNSEAKDLFIDLKTDDPLGYYGLLAQRELQDVLSLPNENRIMASNDLKNFKEKQLLSKYLNVNYLEWLISTGEVGLTEKYLHHSAKVMQNYKDTTPNEWVAIFHYYAKSGNYLNLFSQLGKISAEMRKLILAKNSELIFPTPYFNYVNEYSKKFGVSIEYIYSIMRQESAFNPKARSHMDALGLMQLLPSVAKKSAQENNIDFFKDEDLYNPKTSIALGAAYLKKLWDKYEGKFILATASYNANERAINGWLQTRFRGDAIEFIEDIPYEETKSYIKLVLRNLIFYKIVNSEEKMIAFPNWTLEI